MSNRNGLRGSPECGPIEGNAHYWEIKLVYLSCLGYAFPVEVFGIPDRAADRH